MMKTFNYNYEEMPREFLIEELEAWRKRYKKDLAEAVKEEKGKLVKTAESLQKLVDTYTSPECDEWYQKAKELEAGKGKGWFSVELPFPLRHYMEMFRQEYFNYKCK